MLQHRYSNLSSLESSRRSQQILPTGNGFGGSNLNINQSEQLVFSIVTSSEVIPDCTRSIDGRASSPLVIEAGKIVLLACWLWCSIGASFCSESISAIACSFSQDI
jgi:hypothetical protein